MGASITLTGSVEIDGHYVGTGGFTGTGDGTVQTFYFDLAVYVPSGSKVLGIAASCQSADATTLYPVGTTIGPHPINPSVSVQVPAGVDFIITTNVAVCL